MTFAAPALLVALCLLLPVLVAFLVRRRHRVLKVPSTMLWRMAAVTRARSRRIQNLQRLLALIACLCAVVALVVAAARPSGDAAAETVAIVVDVSASMEAGGNASPLAGARREIARMLAGRGPKDRYAIIAAGAVPRRLAGPTDSAPLLDEGLEAIRVEPGSADLGAALELGASLVAGSIAPRVVLFGDGGESAGDAAGHLAGVPVTERRLIAPSRDNLGVVAFSARPPADARADSDREALVTVATSSDRPRAARITLLADGQAVAERRLEIPALGEAETRLRVRAAVSRITARVEPADGAGDAIAIDDEASLNGESRPPERALLVVAEGDDSSAAFFAQKALEAAGVPEVIRVTPEAAAGEARARDVVVALDRAPARRPDAPTLYLGSKEGALPVSDLRELATPAETRLLSVDADDAILRGVVLDGLTIEKATAAAVPPDARALVELDGGAAVIAGGSGRAAWVYAGIDPRGSDLVLRVAFPVLVANALGQLAGAADVVVAETAARGEVAMRTGDQAEAAPAGVEPEPRWRLPIGPSTFLALVAAALLALELFAYRKGWAA